MNKRQEQRKSRRREILLTALDLFISKGYAATKISDIADRADMSMGLMFHYFNSKEELYEELIEAGLSGPAMPKELDASNPLAFFQRAAEIVLDGISSSSFTAKMFVLMNQAFFDSGAPESARALLSKLDIIEATVPMIQSGQILGVIRGGDPHALSIAFWGSLSGTAQRAVQLPEAPVPKPEWILDIIRVKK